MARVEARRLGRDLRGRLVHLDQLGLADHLDFLVDLQGSRDFVPLDREERVAVRERARESLPALARRERFQSCTLAGVIILRSTSQNGENFSGCG